MNTKRILIACTSLLVPCFYHLFIFSWMLDDAFITFRYAENIASGYGPVYNIGERVEGYTSFLWMAILAVCKLCALDVVLCSKILGIIFTISTIGLTFFSYRFIVVKNSSFSLFATILLVTSSIFSVWAMSGMEVALFTFLILLATLLHLHNKQKKSHITLEGLVCAFVCLTRPDGMIIFFIFLIDWIIVSIKNKKFDTLINFVTPFCIIYIPYFIWRYAYYGFLLPNTYYTKVGYTFHQLIRGVLYTVKFLYPTLLIVMLPFFAFSYIKRFYIIHAIIFAFTFYIILIGGDVMPAFRFFAPILPLLSILAGLAISRFITRKKYLIIILSIIVIYNLFAFALYPPLYQFILSDKCYEWGKETGLWLKEFVAKDSLIATDPAGALPYYSKLKAIDMLGLNDTHISHREISTMGKGFAGHEKGDGDYVLSRMPDYIIMCGSRGSINPCYVSGKEIFQNPSFHKYYALQQHTLLSGASLFMYERIK